MDLLVGSTALPDEEQEAVRKHIAQLLQMRYGFTEEDFLSAELEVVPAGHAREAGLDRSMILPMDTMTVYVPTLPLPHC